jgi:Suppressor of fused protein (SUFU)
MPDPNATDYRNLYNAFVLAMERELGSKDESVIHAIVGFEFGGPPDMLRFRNPPGVKGIFYSTSDLLFFEKQPKSSLGTYEVAICMAKEDDWAEKLLFKLAQATVGEVFEVGDTADITAWVSPACPIKGLIFTKLISFGFEGQHFGTLLCVGITRAELDYAMEHNSEQLLTRLKTVGVFPITDTERSSII